MCACNFRRCSVMTLYLVRNQYLSIFSLLALSPQSLFAEVLSMSSSFALTRFTFSHFSLCFRVVLPVVSPQFGFHLLHRSNLAICSFFAVVRKCSANFPDFWKISLQFRQLLHRVIFVGNFEDFCRNCVKSQKIAGNQSVKLCFPKTSRKISRLLIF